MLVASCECDLYARWESATLARLYPKLRTRLSLSGKNSDPIPTIKEIAQLKHEYEIIQNLNIAGVIKAHELIASLPQCSRLNGVGALSHCENFCSSS